MIAKHDKTLHLAESLTLPNGDKSREYEWKIDDRFHPVGSGMRELLAERTTARLSANAARDGQSALVPRRT